MTVELIRHGNTLWQGTGRYQGKSDVSLSAAGLAELHPPEIGPETVYITRLCRTRQTAERLFPHAKLVETDGLEEMDFGDFEGRSANDMEHDPAYRAWVDTMCQGPCPNGESQTQFIRRVTAAVTAAITVRHTIQAKLW